MTYKEFQRAFEDSPGYALWLRLLGATPDDDVTAVGRLVLETLDALYRYNLVPRNWVTGIEAFDLIHGWAAELNGDITGQLVCMVNQRFLLLADYAAVDVVTGNPVTPPEAASPVLTSALHLQALRDQVEARLANVSQTGASSAPVV